MPVKDENKPTLKQLVAQYYARLYRSALFMSGDAWQAEDIVQDTFLAAGRSWGGFRGESSPYTWLYRIMLNIFRKHLREEHKTVTLTGLGGDKEGEQNENIPASTGPSPQEVVEQTEQARLVREAIDSLPPHHREVLVLRFIEENSYEDIAAKLECSIGTVKSRLHYALKRIGERLRTRDASGTPSPPEPPLDDSDEAV